MKKTLLILLATALLLNFAACNKSEPLTTDPVDQTDGEGSALQTTQTTDPAAPPLSGTDDETQTPTTAGETGGEGTAPSTAQTLETPVGTSDTPVTGAPVSTKAPATGKTPTITNPPVTQASATAKTPTPTNAPTTTQAPVTTNAPATPNVPISTDYTLSSDSSVSGVKNTAAWTTDSGVNFGKYQFMGRGEELTKEVKSKYSGYTITYKLDGKTTTENALQSKVNLMATYSVSEKNVTVNIDSITVRVRCDYTSLKGAQGSFITVGFTTNLPTKFVASIGAKGSAKGDICLENITPTGSNGTYRSKVKLTIPYVTPGTYYLNFSIDSGNANFPFITSIPIQITKGEYADSEYKLLFAGDWDLITASGYKDSLTELFYNSYPRLYARWGTGSEPKTVTFVADKDYDGVAYSSGRQVVVAVNYANSNPHDIGFFSHEITHQVQQYWFTSTWWTENMANYGGFRYFHWSDARYVQLYQDANQSALYSWKSTKDFYNDGNPKWEPYGDGSKWFLTYLDAHWPTTKNANGSLKLGLIDTINQEIKSGRLRGQEDNPYDKNNTFNRIVKEITGYACMEDIRVQYELSLIHI